MYRLAVAGAIVVTPFAVVAIAALLTTAGTQASQTPCKDAEPPASYDLEMFQVDSATEFKSKYEISGKMHRHVMVDSDGEWETIYDGLDTRYVRRAGWKIYEEDKLSPGHRMDVAETAGFPGGRAHLCPDASVLGAEYVETDSIGKRYVMESEKEWGDFHYWTDDEGWLVQVDRLEPFQYRYVFSGLGESNVIKVPEPPYWKPGDPDPAQ